ncbi:RNA polymerase sigma factor [Pontibacter harenae]|uniref:RNA polymerase sigma factor n=1 Tax=Pontibacter harenae TaxID=2894083 RepID=UPI001E569F5F|nr:sigma-70 family RNA polymerase sigma factor [Pontibacter harenae]MCC9167463.1 sigma-70 family RNA polymerase sigma factor [Pontibacter harenae]
MTDSQVEYSRLESDHPQSQKSVGDKQLWDDFRNGSESAYALIYQRHFFSLYSYGLKMCQEREVVKDCIQELFIHIWKNRDRLSSTNSIKFYLYKSLKRKLIDNYKFSSKHIAVTDFELINEAVASEESNIIIAQTSEAQKQRVLHALEKLTDRQKESIILKFYQNLPNDEIGKHMSISVEGVYNLVSKALSNFRKNMSRAYCFLFWGQLLIILT